jgi:dihydroorotase
MQILEKDGDGNVTKFRMAKPTDMHQHLRQGAMLNLVVPMITKRFRTAIVMPNLVPPVTSVAQLQVYLREIRAAAGRSFWPLMTLYLTDTLEPAEVRDVLSSKLGIGIKYYPPGLTTNSDSGVQDPASLWTKGTKPYRCLRELADYGGVFLIHAADGIATGTWDNEGRFYIKGEELDPFDQEPHFICNTLPCIRDAHPELKISIEHLSTAMGAAWLAEQGGEKLGCSLTAHHLLLDRRDVFRRGFNPHRSWMPVIQSFEHAQELRRLAKEDLPFVWLGSDSAPHPRSKKEAACCASGVLMAHAGIELYVEAFEDMGALDERFERFASVNGRKFFGVDEFYGLKPSDETIELERKEWKVEQPLICSNPLWWNSEDPPLQRESVEVVPFRLGEKIRWKFVD